MHPTLRFPEYTDEWIEYAIGDLGTIQKGSILGKSDLSQEGKPCILYGELYTRYGEVTTKAISRTKSENTSFVISRQGDVLIPASGETALDISTATCIMQDDVILGGDLNVFRSEKVDGRFFSYLLNHKKRKDIARLAQGASVVHLYAEQIRGVKILLPSIGEQKKIADFFCMVDMRIANQIERISVIGQVRKSYNQQLFSQSIRFKGTTGDDYPDWVEMRLNELLFEKNHRNRDFRFTCNEVLSVSGEAGIVNQIEHMGRSYAGASLKDYRVVCTGDIVYTKSPLKSNPYGIIKANKGPAGIVSTLYAVYGVKPGVSPEFLDYYFQSDARTNNYIRPLVNKGAKNDMKVNNEHFLTGTVTVPSIEEQLRIVQFLSVIDKKIETEKKVLAILKDIKMSLLHQMFA